MSLGLVAALVGSSCGSSDERQILVRVAGLTPEVAQLYATASLNGVAAQSGVDVTGNLGYFGLYLPKTESGTLTVHVDGVVASDRCKVSSGESTVELGERSAIEVTVTLSTLPAKFCSVIVTREGDGEVSFAPTGSSCGRGCADFPPGTMVTVRGMPGPSAYGAVLSGNPGCSYEVCAMPVTRRVDLRGAFPARACNQSGFCWHNPSPQGNALAAVWGLSASDLWAVGQGGTILH